MNYRDFHRRSIEDRDGFWAEQAKRIHWHKPFAKVLDYSRPPFAKWFVGGETNLCHNAVDRHLAGPRRPEGAGLDFDRGRTRQKAYTYKQLHAEVNRAAAMMQSLGVKRGDRVIIYMPMMPEAVFAILACARIGAIHSVVFGGFAAASLAARIDDARPALMVTADGGSRMGKAMPYKPLVDESHPAREVIRRGKVLIFNRGLDPAMPMVAGTGCRLGRAARRSTLSAKVALRLARIDRAVVHPVHLGHHRQAQGRAARRRRLRGGAGRVDEAHLLRRRRARPCSPPRTSAGWWGTRTSSTRR